MLTEELLCWFLGVLTGHDVPGEDERERDDEEIRAVHLLAQILLRGNAGPNFMELLSTKICLA